MKKKIWLTVAVLAVVGYAELWYSRIDEQWDDLRMMRYSLSSIDTRLTYMNVDYVETSNPHMEKALKDIADKSWNVYADEADMRGLETKMEELIDELRQLNGTMNMLTH